MVQRILLGLYRWKGWKIEGRRPDCEKFIILGAPHTSNWDFVFFLGAANQLGIKPSFMGKTSLFKWPMTNFMLDMGGIPIDRSRRSNVVEQVAAEFARRDQLALVIAAEGTRSSDGEWKSGFYNIARAAGVPIVPTWVCNERRVLGFGPPIEPGANYGETLLEIARFMRASLPDYERYKVLEQQALRLVAENAE